MTIQNIYIPLIQKYISIKRHDYQNKSYIGTIIFNDEIPYFVPLTSAKPKHLKLKNTGIDYLVIYENLEESEIHEKDIIKRLNNNTIKKLISIVDLKKAIPVADGCYQEIDIRHHKDRDLLAKEYEFCKRKKNTIFNKTLSIIRRQKKTKEIKFGYCNFNLLEEKMKEWKTKKLMALYESFFIF